MIIRMLSSGTSFAGLTKYLTRDPGAETSERVAWTQTLNCANDHLPSAVNEMLWSVRDAELLKEQAGIAAGGRALRKPVKHLSLNWSPEEDPTREQMMEATDGFLRHMGWSDHQAVLVAHDDKEHRHVHVMLNVVNPETGKKLDDGFERRRAQEWALEYERANGQILCEQRLLNAAEREAAPTREAWQAFQDAERIFNEHEAAREPYSNDYLRSVDNRTVINSEEWALLKGSQRDQRQQFFEDGKIEFKELRNSIYREVREEFRADWAEYYAAKRDGLDPSLLSEIKAGLLAEQKTVLAERRDEACAELRQERDEAYRHILDEQRDARAELSGRQERGLASPHLLDLVSEKTERAAPEEQNDRSREGPPITQEFGAAAHEVAARDESKHDTRGEPEEDRSWESAEMPVTGVRSGADVASNFAFSLIGGVGSIGDRLFDGFFGGAAPANQNEPKPKPVEPAAPPRNPFKDTAEEGRRRAEEKREREDQEWWDERRARTRD